MELKPSAVIAVSIACLLGGAGAHAAGSPDVSYAEGRLTVRCAQAPLGEVLERIQAATRIELFLEEAVGHTRLTAEIEAQPLNLALESLLEGSGIAYAMTLDPDGVGVARMYVGSEAQAKPIGGPRPSVAQDQQPGRVPRLPVRRPLDRPAVAPPPVPPAAPPAPGAVAASADDEEDDDTEMDDDAELPAGVADDAATGTAAPDAPSPAVPAPVILGNNPTVPEKPANPPEQ